MVASKGQAGAGGGAESSPLIEIEVTPAMISAGRRAIANRWLEFINEPDSRDVALREVFLAMMGWRL